MAPAKRRTGEKHYLAQADEIIAGLRRESHLTVACSMPLIVRVPLYMVGDNAQGQMAGFIGGLRNPQHLLTLADDSLLISDHGAGVIYPITRSSP